MITEDYISFETAKLLKEKGFTDTGTFGYDDFGRYIYMIDHPILSPTYFAFTLQTVMKWLRRKHKLCVEVHRTSCGYIGCVVETPSGTDLAVLKHNGDDIDSGQYTTWEKACEASIKYCLENLI